MKIIITKNQKNIFLGLSATLQSKENKTAINIKTSTLKIF